ncbi:MAG TPA: alpha/beta hydrolase [Thermoanaerobaculia bacterium]|jgi:pimeloyl-ACP methyl ester carboxylesterase|nr:alpha/beta hydrolase [Thermoanaerobaculia bacterium]
MDAELKPRHRTIATNGIRLHAVEAGPEGGPLLVLLHGFPELWYGWRKQIEPLAAAGFHVVAPDQRGYNLSDKPRRVSAYNLDTLALDILGLIDAAGAEKAWVAAHDWGGIVGWWLGIKHPERLQRLALLNTPHPKAMRRALLKSPRQWKKSLYLFYFQLPWLPERTFRRDDFVYATKLLRATSRPGTFSDADLQVYYQAWSQPGAVRSTIHWYRAALRTRPRWPASPRVRVPTLLLWGAKDRALARELAQASIDFCDDGRLEIFAEATHWVQHEEAERVNARLLEFFG